MTYEIGDIVILKSSGLKMTVETGKKDKRLVFCYWIKDDGVMESRSFDPRMLEKVIK